MALSSPADRITRRRLVRLVVVLITVLAALPGLLAVLPAALDARTVLPGLVIEVDQAQFVRLDGDGVDAVVALPDTWALRGRTYSAPRY